MFNQDNFPVKKIDQSLIYHPQQSFQFWYIYFDSLFTKFPLKPTKTACQIFKFHKNSNQQWSECSSLPQLTECYQIIEGFYTSIKNWVSSNCISQQIKAIESNLNQIFLMINIEKKYSHDFWNTSPRRVQSSVCHLYMFFQATIQALLPDDKYTIHQYQQRYHFVTRLIFLQVNLNEDIFQELVNELLKRIEKMYKFMISSNFRQERKLTIHFFNHFNDMFKSLPSLRKSKFSKIPTLIQYLKINNPIEISKYFKQQQNSPIVRGRRATIAQKPKKRSQNRFKSPSKRNKNIIHWFNDFVYEIKSRALSCKGRLNLDSKQNFLMETDLFFPKLFQFPKYIYNYSISFEKQLQCVRKRRKSQSLINRARSISFSFGKTIVKKSSEKDTNNSSKNKQSNKSKDKKQNKIDKYSNLIPVQPQQPEIHIRGRSGTVQNCQKYVSRIDRSFYREENMTNFFPKQKKRNKEQQ